MNSIYYEKILVRFWKIIFRQEPSSEAIRQLQQFIVFGTGVLAAKFLSIAAQILMGRKFGPEVYGQITLIILLSSYFAMPVVNGWGLIFTKIAAKESCEGKKYQALKSLLLIVFLCGTATFLILSVLQSSLTTLLDVTPQVMQLSLMMTFFYAWWILIKQIAQGFQKWHTYILIENIWAAIVLLGIIWLVLQNQFSILTVSGVFFAGYFFSGLILGKVIFKSLYKKIDFHYIYIIICNGWYLLLNTLVGTAAFSIDRILINKSLGAKEVGIYQAHFLSTYGITSALTTIFLTYIFPLLCRRQESSLFLKKVNKIQYPFVFLVSFFIGTISLWLYSLPISFFLFVSLCIFNPIQFHVQIKIWYLISKGSDESKIAIWSQLIFLISNVIVLKIFIQCIGVAAGGVALLISSFFSLLFLIKKEKKYTE